MKYTGRPFADSGNVRGQALQHRHGVLCRGFHADDGAGCGIGINAA